MLQGMEHALVECVDAMRKQRDLIATARDEALATVKEADRLLKPLDRAIAGMSADRKSSSAATGKPRCSTKREVLALMHEVLREKGPVAPETLKSEVAGRLRQRGRSLSMFAKLYTGCLQDPSVETEAGGAVALRSGGGWAQPTE